MRWSGKIVQVAKVYSGLSQRDADEQASQVFRELKAKIALEALRGDRTLQETASKRQVHPTQAGAWKRRAIESLSSIFSGGEARRARDRESTVRDFTPGSGR